MRPAGPGERYTRIAVFGGNLGTMWRVYDRKTSRYVNTLPRQFYAEESARLCALNLNRGHLHVSQSGEES